MFSKILTKRSSVRCVIWKRCLATSLEKESKLLREAIGRVCYIPPVNGGFNGVTMTSAEGETAINAIAKPELSPISHVPVDKRHYCLQMLQDSIDMSGVKGRRDLLCTAAVPGSGKTVVLWFNAYWFMQETKGISVELTFNSDQSHLYLGKRVRSDLQLELAISVRIIHRLLLKFTKSNMVDKESKEGGEVTNALIQLEKPLDCTLRVVKSLLGAPSDTKILLCVLRNWSSVSIRTARTSLLKTL